MPRLAGRKKREYKKNENKGNGFRMAYQRKRVCRFCVDKTLTINYKDTGTLQYFITERGKIIPRRISGNCAKHQRQVSKAIKVARNLALVPFITSIIN